MKTCLLLGSHTCVCARKPVLYSALSAFDPPPGAQKYRAREKSEKDFDKLKAGRRRTLCVNVCGGGPPTVNYGCAERGGVFVRRAGQVE